MSIRATSLLAALTAALAASLATRRQEVPESPEALAEAFAGAVRADDRQALERLVHPRVSDYFRNHEPERWEEVLAGWRRFGFEAGYRVVVRPVAEVHLYDEAQRSLVLGDRLRFRFPLLPPSHFLIFQLAERTSGDGEARLDMGGSNAVEAIVGEDGRWYLTVPIIEMLPD